LREDRKGFWQRWSFPVILGLGYLSVGIVIALFLLVGANSGWSFTGDSAGGIGLVYAATFFIPHLLLFLFTLVAITIQSIIVWSELHPFTKALVLFYYFITALILWSNFSENGGYTIHYYARKFFAPGYYAPPPSPEKLTADPDLRRLLQNYDREASAFYNTSEPARNDHYLALRFWRTCMERHLEENTTDRYRAFKRALDLGERIFRGHVSSMKDAILQEHPSPLPWSERERLDGIIDKLVAGKDDDHPDPCGEKLDTRQIRRLVYRGAESPVDASERWSFLTRRNSRDLLLLDTDRAVVADAERGIELWRHTDRGWRYARTLAGGEGAWRLLRRGTTLYTVLRNQGEGWHLVRFNFDPGTAGLREVSRLRYDKLGEMMDWDANRNGTLLFLANGYAGVVTVDYRDPSRPKLTEKLLARRNNWTNDLLWDRSRQRLYAATRHGLGICRKETGALRCDAPIPPANLLSLVPLDDRRILLFKRGADFNHTVPVLFRPEASGGERFRPFPGGSLSFSVHGYNYLSASHPQNARFDGTRLLLPNLRQLAVLDENLTLLGCLDTGRIYRFVPLDATQILAAQGSEGIREWNLEKAHPARCR
jgi:hypothetical protein